MAVVLALLYTPTVIVADPRPAHLFTRHPLYAGKEGLPPQAAGEGGKCTDTRCGGAARICCEGSPALQKKDMCEGSVDCDSCCGWIPNGTNPCQAFFIEKNATLATYVAATKRFTYETCTASEPSFPRDMSQYLKDSIVSATVKHDVCSEDGAADVCGEYFGVWFYFLNSSCPSAVRRKDPDWLLASLALKCS